VLFEEAKAVAERLKAALVNNSAETPATVDSCIDDLHNLTRKMLFAVNQSATKQQILKRVEGEVGEALKQRDKELSNVRSELEQARKSEAEQKSALTTQKPIACKSRLKKPSTFTRRNFNALQMSAENFRGFGLG
jgi:hypothetical protein